MHPVQLRTRPNHWSTQKAFAIPDYYLGVTLSMVIAESDGIPSKQVMCDRKYKMEM